MVARLDCPVSSQADFARLRGQFAKLPMQPKLLLTREGGTDISSPGRQSLSLLIGEETAGALYATDVYLSPGFGAPPHHQPTEEELWYLLEGELDVRVAGQSARITAGSFAFIPRNTTHTFKSSGTSPAHLLAWNSPAGHERAFEEMGRKAKEGVTAFPQLREIFKAHEILLHADESETAPNDVSGVAVPPKVVPGGRSGSAVLLSGRESGGLFEVVDLHLDGKSFRQRHERSDSCFYVVRGTAALTIDSTEQRVGAGAFAFVPRGHAVSIEATPQAQVVAWRTPAAPFAVP